MIQGAIWDKSAGVNFSKAKNCTSHSLTCSSCSIYGLETVVSVLFTNTRTRWPHNEREIFNTARGVAECSIENFEFIVRSASACICKQNTN